MDWIPHLPPISRGFDATFAIVDHLFKLVPYTPTIDAKGITSIIFDHWVCKFGNISDWDPRFSSMLRTGLMSLLGCKVAMSSTYYP